MWVFDISRKIKIKGFFLEEKSGRVDFARVTMDWDLSCYFTVGSRGCGKTYTLRHTLFLSGILTHLSHLDHFSKGVAKSIVCATPLGRINKGGRAS